MKCKKHRVINSRIGFYLLFLLIFSGLCLSSALDGEAWMAVGFGVFAFVPVFVFFISPLCFEFDGEAVKIIYNFGLCENICWQDIRCIELRGSYVGGGGLPYYDISYSHTEKEKFFMVGNIPKTRKTTKMISTYYKKAIKK